MKIRILKELPDKKVGSIEEIKYISSTIAGYSLNTLVEQGFVEVIEEEKNFKKEIEGYFKSSKYYNGELYDNIEDVCDIAKTYYIKIVEDAIEEFGYDDEGMGYYIIKRLKESK